jgi:hypothetical protein
MADHNPNLVAIQNRALVVLLLQAGLHPVCSKSRVRTRVQEGRQRRILSCTFFFEPCETLDLVVASADQKQLEFLERFARAHDRYYNLRRLIDTRREVIPK